MRDDGTEVEVVVVEPTGAEVQIFARLDGQDINAVLRERLLFKPGEMVKLAPDPALVHVFDKADRQATLDEQRKHHPPKKAEASRRRKTWEFQDAIFCAPAPASPSAPPVRSF